MLIIPRIPTGRKDLSLRMSFFLDLFYKIFIVKYIKNKIYEKRTNVYVH